MYEYEKHVKTIITLQSFIRGYSTRKKYGIKHLPNSDLQDYKLFIKGNDPVISGLPKHPADKHIALIGTSGMRSLELACQLSDGVPKLIILDNSKQVTDFWRMARDIMVNSDNQFSFLLQLRNYVKRTQCNRYTLTAKEFSYLENLFEQYDFNQIKKIIISVSVIAQSWADREVLIKIKNILNYHQINHIYAYPSNIAAYTSVCSSTIEAEKILFNIKHLNPVAAIHTDLDLLSDQPKNFFVIKDHRPLLVKQVMKLDCTPDKVLQDLFNLLNEIFTSKSTAAPLCHRSSPNFFEKDPRLNQLIKKYKLLDTDQPSLEKGLRNAVVNNNCQDVKNFLMYVKNINAQDQNKLSKRTALHWAAIRGYHDIYELLINANADPHIKDARGDSAEITERMSELHI